MNMGWSERRSGKQTRANNHRIVASNFGIIKDEYAIAVIRLRAVLVDEKQCSQEMCKGPELQGLLGLRNEVLIRQKLLSALRAWSDSKALGYLEIRTSISPRG
jgi:hypothetical protein